MGTLLIFSLKSAILLTVIFSVYLLTISRIKGASLRRWALIGIYLTALIIPLFNFNFSFTQKPVHTVATGIQTFGRDIIPKASFEAPGMLNILIIILLIGMMAIALHTLYGITAIYRLRLKGQNVYFNEIKLTVVSGKLISPFCFGNRIFISEEDYRSLSDMVFIHERGHIINRHFIDLIIGRMVLIFQWWNPFAWLMMRELHLVHEFQADNYVLNAGFNRTAYQYMLLNRASGKTRLSLTNGLGYTKLKQRLLMMNRDESGNRKRMNVLLLIPAALIGILLLSAPFITPMWASASMINTLSWHNNSSEGEVPDLVINISSARSLGDPEIWLNGYPISDETMKYIDTESIKSISVHKDSPEYPFGLILIELKDNVEINEALIDEGIEGSDNRMSEWDEIKVEAVGTVKKNLLTD